MLIKIDADKLQQVVEKYQLKLLVYYGSYARQEDFDPSRSDIDIAFISEQQLNSQQLFDLMSDLILLHRKSNIDLVNLQTASGLLKEAVANDGRVLYEKEEGYFQELCPYLYKCYYETRKFRQVKHALFEKKLAEELKNVRPR
ncbi:type VII toxin-antitoxin system MntA family adenylyltransferase antitoxin [Syntrophomonas wolfei]|uniref:type VII toxin-antitoxin system MntA family adenylyltransferase antitoxin n=2 Tax=Syntrophomonas wolfei TaxID=863 RepID=UPI0023EFC6B2|nr:nucleotidyltransferase domain-containing protein [Syntrophomonas wolfei]